MHTPRGGVKDPLPAPESDALCPMTSPRSRGTPKRHSSRTSTNHRTEHGIAGKANESPHHNFTLNSSLSDNQRKKTPGSSDNQVSDTHPRICLSIGCFVNPCEYKAATDRAVYN